MEAFAALADTTRRNIVEMIARQGQMSASDICQQFHVSPPAISQHLKVLRQAQILQMEKQAQRRIYSINQSGMREIADWLNEIQGLWERRLDALDHYLKKMKRKESQS